MSLWIILFLLDKIVHLIVAEKGSYLAETGQFFVCFVIHLQSKLELFISQQQLHWSQRSYQDVRLATQQVVQNLAVIAFLMALV